MLASPARMWVLCHSRSPWKDSFCALAHSRGSYFCSGPTPGMLVQDTQVLLAVLSSPAASCREKRRQFAATQADTTHVNLAQAICEQNAPLPGTDVLPPAILQLMVFFLQPTRVLSQTLFGNSTGQSGANSQFCASAQFHVHPLCHRQAPMNLPQLLRKS
eukprot:10389-Rhodomonas_salina.5